MLTRDHPEILFFRDVVMRHSRSLVRNHTDPKVQQAFREFMALVEANGAEALRLRQRSATAAEVVAWRRFDRIAEYESVMLLMDAVDRKFTPQIWMLSLELLYAIVMVTVGLFENGRYLGNERFKAYEAKYFAFVNSCTSVGFVVNAALRMYYAGNNRPGFFVFASLALLLPVIVTHIIPGAILYFWISIPTVVIAAAVLWLAQRIKSGTTLRDFLESKLSVRRVDDAERWTLITLNVISRVTATFAVTLLLQMSFNYAVLFYHRDEMKLTYVEVIQYEAHSRNWACLIEQWKQDTSRALQFLSTFV